MKAEKVCKDGKVAILISPGYGAGWSTWCHDDDQAEMLLFDARFVNAALDGITDIDDISKSTFGDDHSYTGGWRDIKVVWIDLGSLFKVSEYDGYESVEFKGSDGWYVA